MIDEKGARKGKKKKNWEKKRKKSNRIRLGGTGEPFTSSTLSPKSQSRPWQKKKEKNLRRKEGAASRRASTFLRRKEKGKGRRKETYGRAPPAVVLGPMTPAAMPGPRERLPGEKERRDARFSRSLILLEVPKKKRARKADAAALLKVLEQIRLLLGVGRHGREGREKKKDKEKAVRRRGHSAWIATTIHTSPLMAEEWEEGRGGTRRGR